MYIANGFDNGNIVTNQGYFPYNNIKLPELFLHETLRITKDFKVFVYAIGENNEKTEVYAGDLLFGQYSAIFEI